MSSSETRNCPEPMNQIDGWPGNLVYDRSSGLDLSSELPKITLITPSFNQGLYIEKTIRSVLLQGYPNLEYFVVDGGSTDNTIEVIDYYSNAIDWWVSEADRGQSHAINKGLERASGQLLGWLNSDDYLMPDALFKLAAEYQSDTTCGAIVGSGHLIDQQGNVLYTPRHVPVTSESLFGWCFGNDFMQPSCLFTRAAYETCGGIDETLNFALDVDYWMRIARKYRFAMLPDVLSASLSHPQAKTTSMRRRSHAEVAILCVRYGREDMARKLLDQIAEDVQTEVENSRLVKRFSNAIRAKLRFFSRHFNNRN